MRQNIRYSDFSGGLNTTDNPFTLAANELQQCDNFTINRRGQLSLRRGYVRVNATNDIGGEILGLYRHYATNQEARLVAFTKTGLWAFNDTSGTWDAVYATSAAQRRATFASLCDQFFAAAGTRPVRGRIWDKYQGTPMVVNLTHTGSGAGGATPNAVTYLDGYNGTAQLTGRYRWKFTDIYKDGESAGSPYVESGCYGPQHYVAYITNINPPSGAISSNLYRAVVMGDAVGEYKLVAPVVTATTSGYTDNVPGSLMGDPSPEAADYNGEGFIYCIAKFAGRLFAVANDDRTKIIWTREDESACLPAENVVYIGKQDGQPITALLGLSDRLLVFKSSEIWSLFGDFDDINPAYGKVLISGRIGSRYPFSVASDGNIIYFLADDGVWRYDGNLTCVSSKINTTLKSLPKDRNLEYASGVVYDRKYWLSISEGGSVNDATYVLDLIALQQGNEVWVRYDYGVQCFCLCPNDTREDTYIGPLMAGDANGNIFKLDYSLADNRADIEGIIKSAPLDVGLPNERKMFRKIWPWMQGTIGGATVQVRDDYGEHYQIHNNRFYGNAYRPLPTLLINDDTIAGNTMEVLMTYAGLSYGCDILALEVEAIPRPHR